MNHDLQAVLFDVLEPPRGGLAGLRARLEREGRRRARARRMRWAVAGCVALLVLVAVSPWLRSTSAVDPLAAELQLARMRLGIERAPTEPVTIPVAERHRVAAQRIPLSTDLVVLYRIGVAGTFSE